MSSREDRTSASSSRAAEIRAQLEKSVGSYNTAKQELADSALRGAVFDRIVEILGSETAALDPNRAVFTLGRLREAIQRVVAARAVIAEYDAMRERLSSLERP